ncbi:MAG: LAGLIDADG family homing endonuclease, partial [Patescibacteria group bacterium]
PCITGDTLIYTEAGLRRADELVRSAAAAKVVTDGRFGTDTLQNASPVFETGIKEVYRLITREGYEVRLTANHKVMTEKGWIEAGHLKSGDRVAILNRKGGFGLEGSLEAGRVLGWLVGDGTMTAIRAVLSFFGSEKQELAAVFAQAVTGLVEKEGQRRAYPVGVTEIADRNEARVSSERLLEWAKQQGLGENKFVVPSSVFSGGEEMQRGFLQALFTADGQANDGGEKGCSVRLSSSHLPLLKDVQRLLLNFGIASRIYQERRRAGIRPMPDGHGGMKDYFHQAQHDLAVSKANLIRFANEIGFLTAAKQDKLAGYLSRMRRGPYQEMFLATFEALEFDGREPVYDLKQPATHSFIANGLVVHNCGEQWLGPYENCCLGSINLAKHITSRGKIDWEKLAETIRISTVFLDNVVEANAYVPEIPQLREAAMAVRRIGLGIMGLADAMYALGVSYGGEDGLELAAQIMEFIRYHSMRASIELARDRKPFLAIKGSIYDPKKLTWQPPTPLYPYEQDFGRPKLDWDLVVAGIKKHGIRNGAQTTVAPTGTISTVAGAEGYGCEPVFALSYVRRLFQAAGEDQGKRELSYTSAMFDRALEKSGLDHSRRDNIYAEVRKKGTVQGIKAVPEEIRRVFVVSQDITPEQHIKMQAVLQRFVDNSISKTCNFPADAKVDDVRQAYLEAWKLGCKGLTVYVTGTRKEVVLETEETKQKREGELAVKPRPMRTVGSTYRVDTPVGSAFVTVNENGDSNPLEVFINVGKAGSDIAADAEAIGRLSSLVLRIDPTMKPKERMAAIINQLEGIGGSRAVGFGAQKVRSLADGIAKILKEYLGWKKEQAKIEEVQPTLPVGKLQKVGDICPTCGQATLVNEEGCRKCYSCGYSEC